MAGYVSSAAEDPPEERTHCRCCGGRLCADCGDCRGRAEYCGVWPCRCGIPSDRWQEALDDAEDAAVDDAKVREAEGS